MNEVERFLPQWIRKVLPITERTAIESSLGTAYVTPHTWAEERVHRPRIDYPEKPEPIPGFDFGDRSQIAELVNEVLGFSWSWFDVPSSPNGDGGCYEVKTERELVAESDQINPGGEGATHVSKFWFYVIRTYTWKVLRIYPDKWELWEASQETKFCPNQPRPAITSGGSTSMESDGFWNK